MGGGLDCAKKGNINIGASTPYAPIPRLRSHMPHLGYFSRALVALSLGLIGTALAAEAQDLLGQGVQWLGIIGIGGHGVHGLLPEFGRVMTKRGVDEETGEFLGPSRGEERRAALAVLAVGSIPRQGIPAALKFCRR